mmetsp:Transcript_128631/g.256934  ORF Transcript_128631/g.256934 Transcript_128631/m.256934 type:complete len:234 (+) Transcript_128631:351-1052(+)
MKSTPNILTRFPPTAIVKRQQGGVSIDQIRHGVFRACKGGTTHFLATLAPTAFLEPVLRVANLCCCAVCVIPICAFVPIDSNPQRLGTLAADMATTTPLAVLEFLRRVANLFRRTSFFLAIRAFELIVPCRTLVLCRTLVRRGTLACGNSKLAFFLLPFECLRERCAHLILYPEIRCQQLFGISFCIRPCLPASVSAMWTLLMATDGKHHKPQANCVLERNRHVECVRGNLKM